VSAIDGWLEGFVHGPSGMGPILFISLILGLRHASGPDHLAAITTPIASEKERSQARKAGRMGFMWGLGHGTTLVIGSGWSYPPAHRPRRRGAAWSANELQSVA
jgi:high-affinity nickel permease